LSTTLNSNALNVAAGLLAPAAIIGLGPPSGQTTMIAAWYAVSTVLILGVALTSGGLRRAHGVLIVAGYVLFAIVVVGSS
jgi:hypothetical protein